MAKPLKLASGRVREFAASDLIDATFLARAPIRTLGGRLTLTTALPVTTSDVTAATTIYYALYIHDLVPICDGTNWTPTTYTELSLALDSDSGHTGYQQSGKNFDLFVVNDSGTLRLGTGPAWTSDTARGTGAGTTEIERKNGIWTNKVSMTLRFGSSSGNTITVAANQGTYVGTMRASANGQTTWEIGGTAAGGDPGNLFLWNAYNRVPVNLQVSDNTDSWTYNSTTKRSLNNSTNNRVSFVTGLSEDGIRAIYSGGGQTSASVAAVPGVGFGVNSTTALSGVYSFAPVTALNQFTTMFAMVSMAQPLGFNFLQACEYVSSANTVTLRGDNGGIEQAGITFQGRF